MHKRSFVGLHLDIDSNPDYLAAVVIQFGKILKEVIILCMKVKMMMLFMLFTILSIYDNSNCHYPHEVTKVEKGTRISLVFFLCGHKSENLRDTKI